MKTLGSGPSSFNGGLFSSSDVRGLDVRDCPCYHATSTRLSSYPKLARTDLQDLVEMGYLSPTNLNKRAVGYIKSDKFEELIKSSSK